jgi:hypothetical protein
MCSLLPWRTTLEVIRPRTRPRELNTEMPKKQPTTENGVAAGKPSEQALQAVDVAVGAVPQAADAVRKTVEQWRKPETRSQEIETLQNRVSTLRDRQKRSSELEGLRKRLADEIEKAGTRGGDVRKQVTDQLIGQARKARERLEPVRDRVEPVYRDRLEPVVRKRFEPVYRERVEPVYRERFESAVNRVRERI